MSEKIFTSKEIELLSKNKYVKSVTYKAITYTDEFKTLFIAERSKGNLPIHIFQDAGFDINVIGNNRIWCASKRWRNSYNELDEILSYHISESLALDIATETVKKLIENHNNLLNKDVFIHSDQGVHYTSPRFQKLLKKYNIGQSMSRCGNCWDNAPLESFFGHMKDEIDLKSCITFDELESIIDHYMDYYNNYRYQYGLKN